jgi:23S rRNA (uracil1939-C5)-methyltransferase
MVKNKKQLPLLEDVTITTIAAEGKAIAKVNDLVIFVSYVVPGDVVDLQLTRKKNSYAEAKVIRIKSYSSVRQQAVCEHFGICGGCKWQILPYEEQLKYKQQQVVDNLVRIGKIALPEISPILGSAQTCFYRNKMEYTFSNKRWLTEDEIKSGLPFNNMDVLGFHIPGMFDKVMNINKCWLQDDIANDIRNSIRDFCLQNSYTFFDLRNQEGLMRNIMIRTMSTGEIMLLIQFFYQDEEKQQTLLAHIAEQFPQITSLLYVINSKANDTVSDREIITYKGRDCIYETMENLKFKIGPKSFYQTNTFQAYELYKIARDFAGLTGKELIYDLYTGTGTIANFVAGKARQVIGIEYVPEAVEDAKINSELNGIANTLFFAGDMKDVLTESFIEQYGRPDVIIADPPRAGMHDDVIEVILSAEPQRIVYVSCNPATQARDLGLLDAKYKVAKVQPVDMFPHTHHVENVVLLEIKNS